MVFWVAIFAQRDPIMAIDVCQMCAWSLPRQPVFDRLRWYVLISCLYFHFYPTGKFNNFRFFIKLICKPAKNLLLGVVWGIEFSEVGSIIFLGCICSFNLGFFSFLLFFLRVFWVDNILGWQLWFSLHRCCFFIYSVLRRWYSCHPGLIGWADERVSIVYYGSEV